MFRFRFRQDSYAHWICHRIGVVAQDPTNWPRTHPTDQLIPTCYLLLWKKPPTHPVGTQLAIHPLHLLPRSSWMGGASWQMYLSQYSIVLWSRWYIMRLRQTASRPQLNINTEETWSHPLSHDPNHPLPMDITQLDCPHESLMKLYPSSTWAPCGHYHWRLLTRWSDDPITRRLKHLVYWLWISCRLCSCLPRTLDGWDGNQKVLYLLLLLYDIGLQP